MTDTKTIEPGAAIWNREDALKTVDDDMELLVELANLFLEGSQAALDRIEQAIDTSDSAELYRGAHSLKGSLANFCAPDLRDAAHVLEMTGRNGHLDGARELFQRIVRQVREFEASLEEFIQSAEDATPQSI